jgi:O-antigen/teichoic acid export membrane protein
MQKYLNKLINSATYIRMIVFLKSIVTSGFIHVFSANLVSYLVAFCGSILYARLLGTQNFGIYAFSYNIISFFLLVNGFGAASGILQFVSKAHDDLEKKSYLKFSFTLGIAFNILLSLAILMYAFVTPQPIAGARNILIAMAFFPIGRLYLDIFQSFLRATSQHQLLAKFAIFNNLILLLTNVIGIHLYGLIGFVVSTYLSYLIIILISTFIYKLPNVFSLDAIKYLKAKYINKNNLGSSIKYREFISYSLYATVGNAFSQLLFILDVLLLGYIIKDASIVAIYKVATIIPFALNFIPGIVSTFFYPVFVKHADDRNYIRKLQYKLQRGMLMFSVPVSVVLIIIAKPLIIFIFGEQYQDSVLPFQILAGGFWIISTFRIINGNILASLGHAKFAMWVSIFVMSVNVVLTYILVGYFGMVGAAVSVIIVYILAGLIATASLRSMLSLK